VSEVSIQVRENGPYLIRGPFTIVDFEGTEFEVPAGSAVALCRCGGSTNKPFCDSTHSKIGFDAATRAVRAAEADGPNTES